MLPVDYLSDVTRRLRRGPLLPEDCGSKVTIDRTGLSHLVPHRASMLLVDTIDAIDLDNSVIRGRRQLEAADIGFDGHFPGEPVYPGTFTVEAMGQLALALLHFRESRVLVVPDRPATRSVRATHIHHATFLAPFYPGDAMTLHAQLDESGLTFVASGQAYRGDVLAAFAVSEFYVD